MMDTKKDDTLQCDEVEILQEIMNIAFGQAAADLAEVIDIYVELSVPYIKILHATELPMLLGMSTLSIVSPSSSRKRNFSVPSDEIRV